MSEEISEEVQEEISKEVQEEIQEEVQEESVDTQLDEYEAGASYQLTYDINADNTLTITGFTGTASGNLTIPSTIDGHVVTAIGLEAFQHATGFTGNLSLPETLTTIGGWAFSNCSGLKGTLNLPSKLTRIDDHAFDMCRGFTGDLILPDGLTEIGPFTFWGCSGFNGRLKLPQNVTRIGTQAFRQCMFTGQLILPNSLTIIGGEAFMACTGFTGTLEIPNKITTIEGSTFWMCSGIQEVKFPASLTRIKETAFLNCRGLKSVFIPKTVTRIDEKAFGYVFGSDGISIVKLAKNEFTIQAPKGSAAETYANDNDFTYIEKENQQETPGSTETEYTIQASAKTGGTISPSGTVKVAKGKDYSFTITPSANYLIKDVLVDGVSKGAIDSYTFTNVEANHTIEAVFVSSATTYTLTYTLNQDRTTVSINGYSGSASGDLIIPEKIDGYTVTEIAPFAFSEEQTFTGRLILPKTLKKIGKKAFNECRGLTGALVIPDSVTVIEAYAFSGCDGFRGNLSISKSLSVIEEGIFNRCKGVEGELVLPPNITKIGGYAFKECRRLTGSPVFPNTITEIGDFAFAGCESFSGKLTLPSNLKTIGMYAFYFCDSFTGALVIPDQVTTIGNSSFYECSGFESLQLSKALTKIDDNAFYECTGFKGRLTFPEKVSQIGESAFELCSGITRMYFLNNAVTFGTQAVGYYAPNNVIIPMPKTKFAIVASKGSTAEKYAAANSLYFIERGSAEDTEEETNPPENPEKPVNPGEPDTPVKPEQPEPVEEQNEFVIHANAGVGGSISPSGDIKVQKDASKRFQITPAKNYRIKSIRVDGKHLGTFSGYSFSKVTADHSITAIFEPIETTLPEDESFQIRFDKLATDPYIGLVENNGTYETVYTGSAVKPAVVVNGLLHTLKEGTDYTITYKNNVAVSKNTTTATVIVTGKGHYKGTKTLSFKILPADLEIALQKGLLTVPKELKAEMGKKLTPAVSYRGQALAAKAMVIGNSSTDAEDEPQAVNTKGVVIGEGNVTISGADNFTGVITVPVKVLTKEEIKAKTIQVTFKPGKHFYNEEEQTVTCATPEDLVDKELKVTDGLKQNILVHGKDYRLEYSSNVNAGKAKVTIIGIGDYMGMVTKTFTISPDTNCVITAKLADPSAPIVYNPLGVKPAVSVKARLGEGTTNVRDEALVEGRDYKVTYANNKKVGVANFTVTFLGNYKGHPASKNIRFVIGKASFADALVTVGDMVYTKPGKYFSTPFVTINDVKIAPKEYTVSYYDGAKKLSNVTKYALPEGAASGIITVKIQGKGNYKEQVVVTRYTVRKAKTGVVDLSKAKIVALETDKPVGTQPYTGKPVTPVVKVMILKNGVWEVFNNPASPSKYTVTYANNVQEGTATILITGDGVNAIGSKTVTFKIEARNLNSLIFQHL